MLYFDIGANVGAWALQNLPYASTIVSVEASPSTFASLCQKVGSYSSIKPLHFAISPSSDPYVTFYHCNRANTLSTLDKDWLTSPESRFYDHRDSIQEIRVPTRSLDSLIHEYGVPDLLKVDVEGAENVVLQSLTQKIPLLCFEWAAEWRTKNIECVLYLLSLGFHQFAIQHGDNYTYRPSEFPLTAAELLAFLGTAKAKEDWGMIWAK